MDERGVAEVGGRVMLTVESESTVPVGVHLFQRGFVTRERIPDACVEGFIYTLRAKEKPELAALHAELTAFQRIEKGNQA